MIRVVTEPGVMLAIIVTLPVKWDVLGMLVIDLRVLAVTWLKALVSCLRSPDVNYPVRLVMLPLVLIKSRDLIDRLLPQNR